MDIHDQVEAYLASQPEPKQADLAPPSSNHKR